jgi:Immunity protein 74
MFSTPKVNVVSSDEGFSVEVLGRTGIEYREGDKSVFVDSEVLASGHGIAVFRYSIKAWRPPHGNETMTEKEIDQIVENIRRAMEFRMQPVEVV